MILRDRGLARATSDILSGAPIRGRHDRSIHPRQRRLGVERDGAVHMHKATPEAELPERPVVRLERAAEEAGRTIEVVDAVVG